MTLYAFESETKEQELSTVATDEQIENQLNRLTLESAYLSNLIGVFKDIIPATTNRLKNAVSTFFSEPEYIEVSSSELIKLKYISENADMSSYSSVLVQVPEGFSGNMLEYLNFLRDNLPKVTIELNGLLTEYNTMLAAFISDKETKISLKDNTHIFKKSELNRENAVKAIKTYFKNPNHLSRNALNRVIHQLKEVHPLVKEANSLARDTKDLNLNTLKAKVEESTKLLDIIVEQVSNQGIDKVSGASATNIAKGAHEMAKAVEFASIYYFRIQQALVSAKAITAKIKELS